MINILNVKSVITIAVLILFSTLVATNIYLYKENKKLNIKVSDQSIRLKAEGLQTINFVDKKGNLHAQSIQYSQTIAGLKASKDSSERAFVKMVADYQLQIKDLTQAGQVSSTTSYTAPKVKYVATAIDTTYDLSKLPYIKNLIHIQKDSISNELEVYNNQSILWHSKKETIDPPKKFFLFRWFQKKHVVTYVDVINDNPYIKTTDQNFQIITK